MKTINPTPDMIFTIGLLGLMLALVIALAVPHPSRFQVSVFTVITGMSGACMASAVTGFLQVNSKWVKAGGPLGVLVFLCIFISSVISKGGQ